MNKARIREVATSLTTLVFLVIAISGVMMYFHFNTGVVKELHEILGLVFVVAALLHVIMNWKSMRNYFSKKIFISITLIVTIISILFVSQNLNKGQNPKAVLMQKVLNAPIQDSFKILNGKYANAISELEAQGIDISEGKTIREIAQSNKTSPFRIIAIITNK